jgi:predicted RNase H-like HicB family nuclease
MLIQYIQAATSRATYEILDDGTFYGEIPPCPGVYANADTLDSCRTELQEVLEGWIILGLKLGHNIPPIGQASIDSEPIAA